MEKSAARSHTAVRGANVEQFLPVAQGLRSTCTSTAGEIARLIQQCLVFGRRRLTTTKKTSSLLPAGDRQVAGFKLGCLASFNQYDIRLPSLIGDFDFSGGVIWS